MLSLAWLSVTRNSSVPPSTTGSASSMDTDWACASAAHNEKTTGRSSSGMPRANQRRPVGPVGSDAFPPGRARRSPARPVDWWWRASTPALERSPRRNPARGRARATAPGWLVGAETPRRPAGVEASVRWPVGAEALGRPAACPGAGCSGQGSRPVSSGSGRVGLSCLGGEPLCRFGGRSADGRFSPPGRGVLTFLESTDPDIQRARQRDLMDRAANSARFGGGGGGERLRGSVASRAGSRPGGVRGPADHKEASGSANLFPSGEKASLGRALRPHGAGEIHEPSRGPTVPRPHDPRLIHCASDQPAYFTSLLLRPPGRPRWRGVLPRAASTVGHASASFGPCAPPPRRPRDERWRDIQARLA